MVTIHLGCSLSIREVHKVIQKSTKRFVALKRILMHNEKEGMPVTAIREIKILKALSHPNIVDILDIFVVRSRCIRQMCRSGDLKCLMGYRYSQRTLICVYGLPLHGSRPGGLTRKQARQVAAEPYQTVHEAIARRHRVHAQGKLFSIVPIQRYISE